MNEDKIDQMTLALLYLVTIDGEYGTERAWKGFDWDTMDRLHAKGYISNPVGKTKSVDVSPEGFEEMEKLFSQFFVESD